MNEINIRRSVRSYTEQFVDEEIIEQILKAGMQAPSAGNQRPWEFIVVKDKEILKRLSVSSIYAGCTDKAQVAIVLLVNHNNLRFPEYADQDMGACAQNILLETVNLGLGAVWLGIAPLKDREKAISDIFGLQDNIQPFAIIPIGYPLNEGANQFINRYEPKRVTFY